MTDLERFIELYRSVGIELEPITELVKRHTEIRVEHQDTVTVYKSQILTLEVGGQNKLGGYGKFYTDIVFDMNGKFIEQNIWE